MSSTTKKRSIYMDFAAATPIDPKVQREMSSAMNFYANPSSFNDAGRLARKKVEEARLQVARFIGAKASEIIFTSSGSEANNTALRGVFFASLKEGLGRNEIISTPIEHSSVLEPLKLISNRKAEVKFLKVDSEGFLDLKELADKINSKTLLISVIYANNEIGTIQPIVKIGKIIKEFKAKNNSNFPLFHIDACQAGEYLEMNVNNLGVDLMTFNGNKLYGPRGIGVLYVKTGVKIIPLILGGDQENNLRAGTENLPAIIGMAKAISAIDKKDKKRIAQLRDYFINQISKDIPNAKLNGPSLKMGGERLPNNINVSIPGLRDEELLLELDKYGIYVSSGSACTARSVEPSHVLKAIGVGPEYLKGALRFSLGRQTMKKDIDYVLEVLPKVVASLEKRYKK